MEMQKRYKKRNMHRILFMFFGGKNYVTNGIRPKTEIRLGPRASPECALSVISSIFLPFHSAMTFGMRDRKFSV